MASVLAAGALSCTNLDEITFDRIDANIYYQNEGSVQGAVASIYASAAAGFTEYFWYLNEFSADQIAWRTWYGGAWGWDEAEKFVLSTQTWTSESKIIQDAWEHAWETIGLCNTLINDLESIEASAIGMNQDVLDSYIAEVRTMRAWAYYNNFELWGGALPLNTSVGGEIPGSADVDFNKGCDVIWNFINDELDACYEKLNKEDGSNATRTRINQATNRMLKMRLLLNSELFTGTPRYTECATLCEKIINGDYGTYNLAGDHQDIYKTTNYTCPEVVFAFAMDVDLASYRELESFAQFGSDLDQATQAKLNRGRRTVEVLKQPLHKTLPVEDEVLILYALTHGFLDAIPVPDIQRYELELYDYFASNYDDLLDVIRKTGELPDEDKLNEALKNFNEGFSISKN